MRIKSEIETPSDKIVAIQSKQYTSISMKLT